MKEPISILSLKKGGGETNLTPPPTVPFQSYWKVVCLSGKFQLKQKKKSTLPNYPVILLLSTFSGLFLC